MVRVKLLAGISTAPKREPRPKHGAGSAVNGLGIRRCSIAKLTAWSHMNAAPRWTLKHRCPRP
jgi:hypothetical protein